MGNNQKKIVPRMENYEDDGPWMWVAFAPGCIVTSIYNATLLYLTFRRCPKGSNIFLAIVFGYLLTNLQLSSQLKLPEIVVRSFQ
jgi:hypothetical protein